MTVVVEGGLKLTPDWAAYGDAWSQPFDGKFGADVGARYKDNLDLYAGGVGDVQGNWEAHAGVKWRF